MILSDCGTSRKTDCKRAKDLKTSQIPSPNTSNQISMKKNLLSLTALIAFALLVSSIAQAVEPVVRDMEKAAKAFIGSLTKELTARAVLPMEAEGERTNWHFVPIVGQRSGIDLKDLNKAQESKLTALLKTGLSASGYSKVENIRALETVLFELENSDHRDPELYYISIFGKPSSEDAWGWRFEGHHLSLNYTIVDGRLLSSTPNFWGANPAKVLSGSSKGLRTLKSEEDLARSFLMSLSNKQREQAIVLDKAPGDIYSSDDRNAYPISNYGIAASDLNDRQKDGLAAIMNVYLSNMPPPLAKERSDKLMGTGMDQITFTWAGSPEIGEAHYYRIQGPTFLIEYDNIQNNANHIHAVWRDFNGDFGRDVLWEHHKNAH